MLNTKSVIAATVLFGAASLSFVATADATQKAATAPAASASVPADMGTKHTKKMKHSKKSKKADTTAPAAAQ